METTIKLSGLAVGIPLTCTNATNIAGILYLK